MERPDAIAEKSLNSFGMATFEGSKTLGTNQVGIQIEIPIANNPDFTPPDFRVRSQSPRGVVIEFGDWSVLRREDATVLTFAAYMNVPKGIQVSPVKETVAMSFVDLCWNTGIEPLPESQPPIIEFATLPGVKFADIGWYVPGRVLDHMIDALGKLNDTFLDGALQEAVIYGVLQR